MIEEVMRDMYRMEIPLPKNPLKAVNSYVIKGQERDLIIDTGLNRQECIDAMEAGLKELEVDLGKTDFYITHLHADHFALVSRFATDTSRVYFNQPDMDSISRSGTWEDMLDYADLNGFPKKELLTALKNHPGYKFGSKLDMDLHILKQDDAISAGQYRFLCVETPGHTKGHMCLYEPDSKTLVSGDHILGDITPNIQSWSDDGSPLNEYLASLDKIHELDVDLVLPGHRSVLRNCRQRIEELKQHHQDRAEEVLNILRKGGMSAFSVASEMSWDIDCESWDEFPVTQKWFATGEAIAHLKYLQQEKKVTKKTREGEIVYSKA